MPGSSQERSVETATCRLRAPVCPSVRSTGRPLMVMLKPPKQRMLSEAADRIMPMRITFSGTGAGAAGLSGASALSSLAARRGVAILGGPLGFAFRERQIGEVARPRRACVAGEILRLQGGFARF